MPEPRPLTPEYEAQIRWVNEMVFSRNQEHFPVTGNEREIKDLLSALDHARQELAAVTAERDTFETILEATMKERDLLAGLLDQSDDAYDLPNGRTIGRFYDDDGIDWWHVLGGDGTSYGTAIECIREALERKGSPVE